MKDALLIAILAAYGLILAGAILFYIALGIQRVIWWLDDRAFAKRERRFASYKKEDAE